MRLTSTSASLVWLTVICAIPTHGAGTPVSETAPQDANKFACCKNANRAPAPPGKKTDPKPDDALPKVPPAPAVEIFAQHLPKCIEPAKFATEFTGVFPGVNSIKQGGPNEVVFILDATKSADGKVKDLDALKSQITDMMQKTVEGRCSGIGVEFYFYSRNKTEEFNSCATGDEKCSNDGYFGARVPSIETLAQWKTVLPGVIGIIPATSGGLLFVISRAPDQGDPSKERSIPAVERQIDALLASEYATVPEPFVIALPPGISNASSIATALTNRIRNATVSASDSTRLLIVPSPADAGSYRRNLLRAEIQGLVNRLAVPANGYSPGVTGVSTRLFYLRDNAALTKVLGGALPDVKVAAVGNDSILLSSAIPGCESGDTGVGGGAQDHQSSLNALRSARQLVALVDQPRPQVSLYTWSLQLSGKKPTAARKPLRHKKENDSKKSGGDQLDASAAPEHKMDLASQQVYSVSTLFNDQVTSSISAGWRFLREQINAPSANFFDPVFSGYLRGQIAVQRAPSHSVEDVRLHVKCCGPNAALDAPGSLAYGLGFERLFSQLSPNLMNMLLVVSASSNPAGTADCLVDRLELKPPPFADTGGQDRPANCFRALPVELPSARWNAGCQAADDAGYRTGSKGFEMECTRKLLHELFSAESADEPNPQLGRFRATVADFLFQDKLMAEYPNEFDAYLEPASASKLDAQLVEFVDAFESDLAVLNYRVRDLVAASLNTPADKGQFYDYSGIVSVKVVAGNQALVQSQAQNYFPATPPVTLKDVLGALSAAGSAAANPSALPGNVPAEAVTSALAGLAQIVPAKQTVSIGRELDMTVTPYSLSAGDGAEMDIDVTSKDNGASVVGASATGTSTAADDLSSRVANDHVKTHVRLESLKMFELSALDSTLARGKTPWKLVDPYLEIPMVGELVRVPRRPDIIQQRSIVFLSAVVVPTAADLAATPIEEDLDGPNFDRPGPNLHSLSSVSPQLLDRLKEYHRRILDCLSATVTDDKGGASGCTSQTMAAHARLLGLSW